MPLKEAVWLFYQLWLKQNKGREGSKIMHKHITVNHHSDVSFNLWLMNDKMFCASPIVWAKVFLT